MPDVEAEVASERERFAVIAIVSQPLITPSDVFNFLFKADTDTTDKDVNDSAIEIAPPALEKKQDDAKHDVALDDELDVGPAHAEKPSTGAVNAGESNAIANVEVTPEGMGHSQNGEAHVTHVNVGECNQNMKVRKCNVSR